MNELTAPKVFISYSHDSDEHSDLVLALADSLVERGLDVILDQYEPNPGDDWPHWMEANLDEADFVLMICTETYYNRVMRKEVPGKGKGVMWEGTLIYNRIYNVPKQGHRFIPILLEGIDPQWIPGPVKGYTYYNLKKLDFTDSSYEALYRHLTRQPFIVKPDLGETRILPPRTGGSRPNP